MSSNVLLDLIRSQGRGGEDRDVEQLSGAMNRGLLDRQSTSSTRLRSARVHGNHPMSVTHNFTQRLDREVRRAHEDKLHFCAITSDQSAVKEPRRDQLRSPTPHS
jgi:hypothetical protein